MVTCIIENNIVAKRITGLRKNLYSVALVVALYSRKLAMDKP